MILHLFDFGYFFKFLVLEMLKSLSRNYGFWAVKGSIDWILRIPISSMFRSRLGWVIRCCSMGTMIMVISDNYHLEHKPLQQKFVDKKLSEEQILSVIFTPLANFLHSPIITHTALPNLDRIWNPECSRNERTNGENAYPLGSTHLII